MALLRVTCCPDSPPGSPAGAEWALFAPESDGEWVPESYDPYRRTGRLGLLRTDPREKQIENLVDHFQRERSLSAPDVASDAPICVMVHGFQYDPRAPASHDRGRAANPHAQIYHFSEDNPKVERVAHTTPWPLRLGFREDDGETGLAVAFGWASDPTYARGDWRDWLSRLRWSEVGAETYYATAYRTAPIAAAGLARTIEALAQVFPNREIDVVAHSLGARVTLRALLRLSEEKRGEPLKHVGRVILLSAAPHWLDAMRAIAAIAKVSRMRPQIFNMMVSRDATLSRWGSRFAAFAEMRGDQPRLRDRLYALMFGGNVVGLHGKPPGAHFSAWMDLYLDLPPTANWASRLRPPLDFRPTWRWSSNDHWSCFTWPPYMTFYGKILRERKSWSLNTLRWGEGKRTPIPQGRRGKGPLGVRPRAMSRLRALWRLATSKLGLGRKS